MKMKFLMNIWRRRRIFAQMLLAAMMMSYATPAMAAETGANQPAVVVDEESHTIYLNWDDMMVLGEPKVEPRSTKINFVNKAGTTSSDLSIPFTVGTAFPNSYFILTCSYLDGTTGTLSGGMANYTGTVYVDGATRTICSGVLLPPGDWKVVIKGIKKSMAYVVKVYALV